MDVQNIYVDKINCRQNNVCIAIVEVQLHKVSNMYKHNEMYIAIVNVQLHK